MFPKALRLLICFVLLALLLCACQTPEAPNDGDKTADSTGEETTADPTAIFDGEELPAWKSAYVEILRDCREWTTHYALISLDDDAIPELYVVGRAAGDGSRLYSYQNGTVKELEMNFTSREAYFERSGKIAYCGERMGNGYVTVCELTEEGFVTVLSASSVEHIEYITGEHPDDFDYTLSYEYFVEGQSVSEAEYESAIAAVFDFEQAAEFPDSVVSYEEICNLIFSHP